MYGVCVCIHIHYGIYVWDIQTQVCIQKYTHILDIIIIIVIF